MLFRKKINILSNAEEDEIEAVILDVLKTKFPELFYSRSSVVTAFFLSKVIDCLPNSVVSTSCLIEPDLYCSFIVIGTSVTPDNRVSV